MSTNDGSAPAVAANPQPRNIQQAVGVKHDDVIALPLGNQLAFAAERGPMTLAWVTLTRRPRDTVQHSTVSDTVPLSVRSLLCVEIYT